MRNIRKERRKVLLLPISILAISTAAIFIRFAQRTIPSTVIAAYRLLLASLFLLPFTIKKAIKELNGLPLRSHLLLLFSGFLLALHFASWIISLELTNVLSSVVLVTTTPIWVSAISPLFFKAKISRRFWIGLMVAFIGILIVSDVGVIDSEMISFRSDLSGSLPEKLIGNGLALLGAFCAAGYVIIGRKQRQDLTTGTYAFIVYSFAAILLPEFN